MFTDLKPHGSQPECGLPPGWSTARLGSVAQLIVSNVDKLSHDEERPVRLCNYVDVYKNEEITSRLAFMRATATKEEIRRFRLRHDDVLITKDSESWTDIGVPAYVRFESDELVCGYHLAMLRTRKSVLMGAFLRLALLAPTIRYQFHVAATGVTRYGLSQSGIRNATIPVPPIAEQAAIVKYLAHAHARIDRAIAAKRKLIALLDEQKRSVMVSAVTRGLSERVAMRATGTWLGEVPDHWHVTSARHVSRIFSGSTPSRAEPRFWETPTVPWVASSALRQMRVRRPTELISQVALDEHAAATAPAGSVLVGLVGQGRTRGAAAILEIDACINQNVAAMVPSAKIVGEYLFAVVTAGYRELRSLGRGGNQAALNGELVKAFRVPLPPLDEQRAVVAHIQAEAVTADAAIERARREIELLREFRTRLTSDVVTGQVDVRHIAAALPDLDQEERTPDVGGTEDALVDEAAEFLEDFDA